MSTENNNPSAPFAAFRVKEFTWYLLARFGLILGAQMQYAIVGWHIYKFTKDPLSLGLIGLAEALPFISIALFAGHIADIIDRKKIILAATVFMMTASFLLFWFTLDASQAIQNFGTLPIYGVIFMTGIARGFIGPTYFALLPQIVSRELIPNAATWSTTAFHVAAVAGPAAGGLILGLSNMTTAYSSAFFLITLSFICILFITNKSVPKKEKYEPLLKSVSVGLRFVFKNQIVLSALSLDLFAVLFGGATALLPIFALDILKVGEEGYGFLRAAPAFGAVMMAGVLAYYPPKKNAGTTLLWSVTAFGVCMILFAISKNYYLSLFILAISGAFDNVSVVVRHIILQLSTPDEMRGRVASVNGIFIGSSNEIGSFESGVAARLLGLIPSVIFGGSMTVLIVGLVAKVFPKLRKLNLKEMV
ncbi:MAG: MFS transporter [Bacteroidetes bacterium]|nr:MFS transporter [Bacteroidota bacterium]